ncbi:MAG: hypothetical protein II811_00620 [Spirochaetaceae bacterium]|nr:hypothetical protein [Spirochaetaceae bacterium]
MTLEEARNTPIFLAYQNKWINDNSPLKIWEKSRRIGASWCEAFVCAKLAALAKAAGGMDCFYMAYEKEMTQQFISDVAFWAKALNIVCGKVEEVVIKDEDKDILLYKIRFASGFEVWALPSKARLLRSKQGHFVFDEAAFADEFHEILKAAHAFRIWGGSISILSTHNGEDNPFNLLLQDIKDGKKKYSLHHTTIVDALDDGLYKRICTVQNKSWSEEAQEEWLKDLLDEAGDFADEEYFCIPTKAGERYFSAELIRSVTVKGKSVFRFAAPDSFTFEKAEKREKEIRKWFKEVKPTLLSTELPVVAGEDFARSGDITVLHFDTELSDGSTDTLCEIELRNVPFEQQRQFIQLCFDTLKNFDGAAFDSRGNGQMIAEWAAQEYPGCIFQVMLSRKWYAENFPLLKTAFEEGKSNIPDDSFITDDYKVVGLVQGVPLITERTGSGRNKRHGDSCIAKVMAHFAHRELDGTGYQAMTYEAVETPNRFRHRKEDNEW